MIFCAFLSNAPADEKKRDIHFIPCELLGKESYIMISDRIKTVGAPKWLLLNWRFCSKIRRLCLALLRKNLDGHFIQCVNFNNLSPLMLIFSSRTSKTAYCQNLPDMCCFWPKTQWLLWFFVLFHAKSENYVNLSF